MSLNEKLTLVAIVLGPVFAVCVTLWVEHRRKVRERRVQIMRMMLSTRHMPADPQWNAAVNLIPAEFNDQEEVMTAWRAYHAVARERHAEIDQPAWGKRLEVNQSALVFHVMRSLGLTLSEGDIQTEAYVSKGFVDRERIYIDALRAIPRVADTLDAQRALTQIIVDCLPGRGPQSPPPGPIVPRSQQDA